MDFSQALQALKEGLRVRRQGWNGPRGWITKKEQRLMGQCESGPLVDWAITDTDLLADDWEIVK